MDTLKAFQRMLRGELDAGRVVTGLKMSKDTAEALAFTFGIITEAAKGSTNQFMGLPIVLDEEVPYNEIWLLEPSNPYVRTHVHVQ